MEATLKPCKHQITRGRVDIVISADNFFFQPFIIRLKAATRICANTSCAMITSEERTLRLLRLLLRLLRRRLLL